MKLSRHILSWFVPAILADRWHALDRLRALAVVVMVQGHTFSALLRPGELAADVNHWHDVLHGLTAPAFFFGAGLAFGTATYPAYACHQRTGRHLRMRLQRYLLLGLLGYGLQLPGGSLIALTRAGGDQLTAACRVGPLQLIAFVLTLCQLATLRIGNARKHALCAAIAGVLVLLAATPIARSGFSSQLGIFLGSYLEDRGGSHFPIFPWASFVLFGIAGAGLLIERARLLRSLPFLFVGSVMSASAYVTYQAAAEAAASGWLWRTSPSYFLFRLGLILVLLGLLHRPSDREVAHVAAPGPSAVLARHSLVAYVAHLLLLYGTPVSPNFARMFSKSLSLPHTSALCALLLIATVAVTQLWDWLEREQLMRPRHKQLTVALLALILLAR